MQMQPDRVSFLSAVADCEPCVAVTLPDITVCISVRLTDINPWVSQRLSWLADQGGPAPRLLILDFGSAEPYASQIRQSCEALGAEYRHINDDGDFSLAAARNAAFASVQTEFVFFTDIDFVFGRNFFVRLVELCNSFEMRRYPRRMLSMPAYHVSRNESILYESRSPAKRDRLINEWCLVGAQTEFGELFEFIAPYSNNILCHRSLFSMVGGYCTQFRGHGSEDFDFFIRLAMIASDLPLPDHPHRDCYSPLTGSFWGIKEYTGFRRLLELFTYPSESLGLKAFHIWHPRPRELGYWTSKRDRNRERFNAVVARYLNSPEKLLDLDFLPRSKRALCLCSDKSQWGYFLPLRLADYQLSSYREGEAGHRKAVDQIRKREVKRIFVHYAALKRDSRCRAMVELARGMGIDVTVLDYGVLPGSLYFSHDDRGGQHGHVPGAGRDPVDCEAVDALCAHLREVSLKAGANDLPHSSLKKRFSQQISPPRKVFVPLQSQDALPAAKSMDGYISYADFIVGLKKLVRENESTVFFLMKHPVTGDDVKEMKERDNVVICKPSDNIHAIIRMCDAVLVYNSDIAVLSLFHDKPVYHCGRMTFDNSGSCAVYAPSPPDLMQLLREGVRTTADAEGRRSLLFRLIREKYSFYYIREGMQVPGESLSRHAKTVFMEQLVLDGQRFPCGLGLSRYPFSWRSYVTGHLTCAHQRSQETAHRPSDAKHVARVHGTIEKFFRSSGRFFRDAVRKGRT